jgi:cyclopropane fatty-acyl-phospholipid synthase-like methyltransferase
MNLLERKAHFEFGENWKAYAKKIDQRRIDSAVEGVQKLFPEGLAGKSFLDIGCGSGLHSLAATKLGAASVMAIDLDENSVETTRQLLSEFSPHPNWRAAVVSIFDAAPQNLGTFDVVYSWGVLHHTGAMWRAIERAGALVAPEGQFAIAIYAATAFDSMWTAEKRFYAHAPRPVQWGIRQVYMAVLLARMASLGQNPVAFVRNYLQSRGMHFSHDVHDWLGGFPYETAEADELIARVGANGFTLQRSFLIPRTRGLLGTGCNELVFRRN